MYICKIKLRTCETYIKRRVWAIYSSTQQQILLLSSTRIFYQSTTPPCRPIRMSNSPSIIMRAASTSLRFSSFWTSLGSRTSECYIDLWYLYCDWSVIKPRERLLDFGKQEQKEDWYTRMMPNGRIPVLQDHWNSGKVVWESNAMLKYIAERYDTERKFLVDDADLQTDVDTCEFTLPL